VGGWPALVVVDVGDELVGETAADASTRDEVGMLDGVAALGETLWLGEVAEARPAVGTAGA
jgi:hypothetical protein